MTNPPRILVVRLGSMGDVIAALPAMVIATECLEFGEANLGLS